MKNFKSGNKVSLTEDVRDSLGLPDIEYEVKEVLKENVDCPIVLEAEELGKDWVQFFASDELILITKN